MGRSGAVANLVELVRVNLLGVGECGRGGRLVYGFVNGLPFAGRARSELDFIVVEREGGRGGMRGSVRIPTHAQGGRAGGHGRGSRWSIKGAVGFYVVLEFFAVYGCYREGIVPLVVERGRQTHALVVVEYEA